MTKHTTSTYVSGESLEILFLETALVLVHDFADNRRNLNIVSMQRSTWFASDSQYSRRPFCASLLAMIAISLLC